MLRQLAGLIESVTHIIDQSLQVDATIEMNPFDQPQGIHIVQGIVACILVEVGLHRGKSSDSMGVRVEVWICSFEADEVFLYESATDGAVLPRPVVVQPRPVIFPSRELEGVRGGTGDGGLTKGSIAVGGGEVAALIREGQAQGERVARSLELVLIPSNRSDS